MARNLKNAERALKHRNRPSVSVQTCLTSKRPSLTSSSRLPILMSQNNTVSGSCRCVLAFNPTNPTITSMPPCCVCTAPSSSHPCHPVACALPLHLLRVSGHVNTHSLARKHKCLGALLRMLTACIFAVCHSAAIT